MLRIGVTSQVCAAEYTAHRPNPSKHASVVIRREVVPLRGQCQRAQGLVAVVFWARLGSICEQSQAYVHITINVQTSYQGGKKENEKMKMETRGQVRWVCWW